MPDGLVLALLEVVRETFTSRDGMKIVLTGEIEKELEEKFSKVVEDYLKIRKRVSTKRRRRKSK